MKNENGDVNDAFSEADFGDKLWLFFRKNFGKFAAILAIIFILAIGFFVGKVYSKLRIRGMQRAYSELKSKNDGINFVKKYGKHRLAGVASLVLGDGYVADGDYNSAISAYETAERLLKSTIILPRVLVSKAEAMYRSNRFDEAEKILNFVIYDGHFDRAFRGNAVCVLAMMLEDSDNSEKLESLLNNLDGLDLTPRAKDAIAEIVTKK